MTSPQTTLPERLRLFQEASLPLAPAILLLVGVFLVLLGLLLFPVSLGIIPFSPDGQLGLLLVITAIQMMALGQTPVGQYTSSWLMVIIGTGFAATGVVSCIVPGILTHLITIFLGVLNITGGVLLLGKLYNRKLHDCMNPPAEPVIDPPIVRRLKITGTTLNIVSIAFGASMLMPGLIPGVVVAMILIINGLLLFKMVSLLVKLP